MKQRAIRHHARAWEPVNWDLLDLVVFDVDGTLYDQRRLRVAMLSQLLAHAWQTHSVATLRVLRTFRRIRESLADQADGDFMIRQYQFTAQQHHTTEAQVRALTHEWMEQRPLPLLAACRYALLPEVFAGLRAKGKQIAVFSDYPAAEKLMALGLRADLVVCATDASIGRLKPDPLGLETILKRTGVAPERVLMLGDRFDRDAMSAQRCGVRALIRSSSPHPEFRTFASYADPLFEPLLEAARARREGATHEAGQRQARGQG